MSDLDTPSNTDTAEQQIDTIINSAINMSTSQLQPIPTVITSETIAPVELDSANVEVFNTALHQYLRIDEEIKSLMTAIKTRNEMKKNLAETLSNFLKVNKIKKVDLDGSYKGKRIENVVTTTTSGFNRETVTEAIYNELKEDQEVFDKIMQALSRTSVMKEVWKLKIVEEKQARKSAGTGTGTGKGRKKKNNTLDEASQLIDN
jgi:Asp-tRNA(Asn)/Glu-tRNA(Gln) amidotransferase C subunit